MRSTVALLLFLAISNAFAAPAKCEQIVLLQGKPAGQQTIEARGMLPGTISPRGRYSKPVANN